MKTFLLTILAAILIPGLPALMLSLLPRNAPVPLPAAQVSTPVQSQGSTFTDPLGVTYGPYDYLWVAEATPPK